MASIMKKFIAEIIGTFVFLGVIIISVAGKSLTVAENPTASYNYLGHVDFKPELLPETPPSPSFHVTIPLRKLKARVWASP